MLAWAHLKVRASPTSPAVPFTTWNKIDKSWERKASQVLPGIWPIFLYQKLLQANLKILHFYLSQLSGGGRGELNLGVFCKGFQSWLRKSQEISGGLSDEVEGHSDNLQTRSSEIKMGQLGSIALDAGP